MVLGSKLKTWTQDSTIPSMTHDHIGSRHFFCSIVFFAWRLHDSTRTLAGRSLFCQRETKKARHQKCGNYTSQWFYNTWCNDGQTSQVCQSCRLVEPTQTTKKKLIKGKVGREVPRSNVKSTHVHHTRNWQLQSNVGNKTSHGGSDGGQVKNMLWDWRNGLKKNICSRSSASDAKTQTK